MKVPEKGVVYRASPRAFVWNYVIAAGVVLLSFLVFSRLELGEAAPYGYLAVAAVLVYLCGEPFIVGFFRYYVVSSSEVSEVSGVLWKRRHAIPHQGIAEVSVTRGLFGRILNYGTVAVESNREGGIHIRHVHDPEEVRRLIHQKLDSSKSVSVRLPRKRSEDEEGEDGEEINFEEPEE